MGLCYREITRNHFFTMRIMSAIIKDSKISGKPQGCSLCIGGQKYEAIFDSREMSLYLLWNEGGKQSSQAIKVVAERSNLIDSSFVYYFICPLSGRKTRTMYRIGEGFVNGRIFKGVYYRNQSLSKKHREIAYRENPERKYGKKYYRGIETPYGKRCKRYEEYEEKVFMAMAKYLKI